MQIIMYRLRAVALVAAFEERVKHSPKRTRNCSRGKLRLLGNSGRLDEMMAGWHPIYYFFFITINLYNFVV